MRTRFALILLIALAGVARAGDSPAPRPNAPDDFVRYIFDVNDSVFSEA